MTESHIRFYDEQRADSIDFAQERSLEVFRENHPDATVEMMRTQEADSDEKHDYEVTINGVQ